MNARHLWIPTLVLVSGLASASLAPTSLAARAQEPDVEIVPPGEEATPDEPSVPEAAGGGASADPQDRLRELFRSVERRLEGIDILLTDAAAGDTSTLSETEDAGIDRLLEDSIQEGREVQSELEEILEIAQQMGQQPGSAGSQGGQPQSQGGSQSSPQQGQGQDRQASESTPSLPEEGAGQQGGEKPQDGEEGEKPGGEEEGEARGQDPKSPRGSAQEGENRDGDESSEGETGPGASGGASDSGWGNLPQHVRDTFQAEGRGELPSRYRDWIDSYYHKLNRRSRRR